MYSSWVYGTQEPRPIAQATSSRLTTAFTAHVCRGFCQYIEEWGQYIDEGEPVADKLKVRPHWTGGGTEAAKWGRQKGGA
jgi:hypothetical protein